MRNKKPLIIFGSVFILILIVLWSFGSESDGEKDIIVNVSNGPFKVEVNTSGELEARNSTFITGPQNLRRYRIYQFTIQRIIPEGTYVKKGQFVASLDPSDLNTKIKDSQISLGDKETKLLQTRLDTALQMREARDKLYNLEYAVKEKGLILEQSQFEPPATIKRVEIEFEKAQRQFAQEQENYKIKKQKYVANMQIASSSLRKEKLEMEDMMNLLKEFNIRAPQDGMLIYQKGYDGRPIKEGSQINSWGDATVATLPDLSSMNSITYVNEVDIRRIQNGQFVEIGLDAFPDKNFIGKITQVANIGEQRPNSDSKVFKIVVEIDKIDESLRPGMTTSNNIITSKIDSTLFIPLECLHSFQDSITYVYVASGISYIKKEVQIGETNTDAAEVLMGLESTNRVYLSKPVDSEDEKIELLEELNGKRNLPKPEKEKPKPRKEKSQYRINKPSI